MNRTRVEEEIEAEGERSLVVVFACYWPRQTINQTQQLQHCNDCYVSLRVVTCTLRLCIANKIAERMSTRSPRESSTHGTSCDRNYPQQTPPFIPFQVQPYSLLLIQTSIQPYPILPLFPFTCIFSPTGMLLVSLQSEVMLG